MIARNLDSNRCQANSNLLLISEPPQVKDLEGKARLPNHEFVLNGRLMICVFLRLKEHKRVNHRTCRAGPEQPLRRKLTEIDVSPRNRRHVQERPYPSDRL